MHHPGTAPLSVFVAAFVGGISGPLAWSCSPSTPAAGGGSAAPVAAQEQFEPGPAPADVFHPEKDKPVAPAYGGRAIVHMESMPQHIQRTTENSAVVERVWLLVHDWLGRQDFERWHIEPRVATGWEIEDSLVLAPEAAQKYGAAVVKIEPALLTIAAGASDAAALAEKAGISAETPPLFLVYGSVEDAGGSYKVTARSERSPVGPIGKDLVVAKEDVLSLERDTVFTFHLRKGVKWQDGHPFDAEDVRFSWEVFQNPEVDCDEIRNYYAKVLGCEVLDPATVRFFYKQQYFGAEKYVCEMPLLASHVFNLLDPDNRTFDPAIHADLERKHGAGHVPTLAERGEYVNNHKNNNDWIGLGTYKVVKYDPAQYIDVERWDGYYDAGSPLYGGYFDTVRFRYIKDDNAAFQALLNGELDFFARVKSEDYFGESTKQKTFTDRFYKGYFFDGTYGYTGWNLLRPKFQDKRVRHALAHAFDMQNWLKTKYMGLGKIVTGPSNYFSDGYDMSVKMLEYDPDRAEELLAEAGWYDRDGDDTVDKDGIPLEIEFLYPSGNQASEDFGIAYQQALAKIGVKLTLRNLEWATYLERVHERDFDSINMAWVPELENDPEQIWHSSGGPGSSNNASVKDAHIDELIAKGQVELDPEKRAAVWRELHAYIYDLQPYLFMIMPPRKFAMNKAIRGVQTFLLKPGYDPKRWYYPEGTPGTRATHKR